MSSLTTWEDRALASGRRLGDHFGGMLTLYRLHSLYASVEGRAPAALEVRTPAGAGAASLDLHFTEVDGVPTGSTEQLEGVVPPGLELTIAGTTYEVQAQASVASNRLDSVAISPVLVAPVSAGDVVELAASAEVEYTGCTVDKYDVRLIDGEQIQERDLRVTIPREGAVIAPPVNTYVRTAGGELGRVIGRPEQLAGEWVLQVGAR